MRICSPDHYSGQGQIQLFQCKKIKSGRVQIGNMDVPDSTISLNNHAICTFPDLIFYIKIVKSGCVQIHNFATKIGGKISNLDMARLDNYSLK